MSLLIDPAPHSVVLNGQAWDIRTDFRIALQFESLMLDRSLAAREKVILAINLFFPKLPPSPLEALDSIRWFYACGKGDESQSDSATKAAKRIYDYDYDDAYIFAAFLSDYGIDLEAVPHLHWWKFKALFDALKPDNTICKIMEWRGADTKKMKGEQKIFYQRMQRLYALPCPREEREVLDKITQALIDGRNLPGNLENLS